ncbi:MAG: IS3 family transposase [Candidatus Kapaibacterium sp.]
MCRVLKVSKSGYYKYLKKSAKEQFELENKLKLIEEIYKSSRCTYGSRKVTKSLKAKGISCYKNQIAKIMKQEGLFAKGRKRYRITTN